MTPQSDEEFVTRIRRRFLLRRRSGLLLLVFGVLLLVGAFCAYWYFEPRFLELTKPISRPTTEPAVLEAANKIAFLLGVKLATFVTAVSLSGVTGCLQGLYLLLGARKERLLLQYHDELKGIEH